MNKLTLMFGVLLCLVMVNARHFSDRQNEPELFEHEEETLRRAKEHIPEQRHRRRRWQMNYDYPPPNYYYQNRRDYDQNSQQEMLQNIYKLLEDISAYIRRPPPPPPPPQPIYIPYPVPYPTPQIRRVVCNIKTDAKQPNVTVDKRITSMTDLNQNWGLVVTDDDDYDDGSDGSRPINFDPITPKQVMKIPAPDVEHGSAQASMTTHGPSFLENAPQAASTVQQKAVVPGLCNAAILSCCGMSNDKSTQGQCFANIGCSLTFTDGKACSSESIQAALESFKSAYSPVN